MQGEITEVRTAAARTADASKALVAAAEKLAAEVARQEAQLLDLDAKSDRLSRLHVELSDVESELKSKRQALEDARAAYAAFMAALPRSA